MLDQVLIVHGLESFLGGFGGGGVGVGGSDNVLDSRLLMVHLHECMKWQTCSYACHCLGKVWGVGGGCDNVLDSMLQMVHVHEVTIYVFFMK